MLIFKYANPRGFGVLGLLRRSSVHGSQTSLVQAVQVHSEVGEGALPVVVEGSVEHSFVLLLVKYVETFREGLLPEEPLLEVGVERPVAVPVRPRSVVLLGEELVEQLSLGRRHGHCHLQPLPSMLVELYQTPNNHFEFDVASHDCVVERGSHGA